MKKFKIYTADGGFYVQSVASMLEAAKYAARRCRINSSYVPLAIVELKEDYTPTHSELC